MTGEKKSTRIETYPNVILSTRNSTWTAKFSNRVTQNNERANK